MTRRYGKHRGGCCGHGGTKKSISTTKTSKKTIEDYFFYVGSSKQASDYEITTEYVINHIKKLFD